MTFKESSLKDFSRFFAPLLFALIAFNLYLVFEIHTAWTGILLLRNAKGGFDQQIERVQRDLSIARNLETMLDSLAQDILTLSVTNAEAQKLVEKYNLRPKIASDKASR